MRKVNRVQSTMTTMTPYDLRHVEVIIFLDDLPPHPLLFFVMQACVASDPFHLG